jgi:hypothetical protein
MDVDSQLGSSDAEGAACHARGKNGKQSPGSFRLNSLNCSDRLCFPVVFVN